MNREHEYLLYLLRRSLDAAEQLHINHQHVYDEGFEAGVRSVWVPDTRPMTGQQFMARLMTQVSPDSAAWAELHALSARGFGGRMVIEE